METTTILKDRRVIFALSIAIAGVVFVLLLMFLGVSEIFGRVLELQEPKIIFKANSDSLSLAAASIEIKFIDSGAGLDSYKVSVIDQNNHHSIVSSGNLNGSHEHTLRLTLPGSQSNLSQGQATILVSVSDRSIWANTAEYNYNFQIDLERPTLELIEIPPQLLQGGAYLLLVRAIDNSQRVDVGLKIGSHTFKSYPAKGLDRAFDDPNLYVIPFTYPLDEDPAIEIPTIFAEDIAGNGVVLHLKDLKVEPRHPVEVNVNVTPRYLQENVKRTIAENESLLEQFLGQLGGLSFLNTDSRSASDDFRILNEYLVPLFERKLYTQVAASRFDRYWFRPFFKPSGRIRVRFMALEKYVLGDTTLGKRLSRGYVIQLASKDVSVQSLGDGVVMYSGDCGHNRACVAIDHGLGIVSVFGMLESVLVRVGERIEAGAIIGKGTLFSGPEFGWGYYVELDVQGVPVEIRDWWNAEWFSQHISAVIGSVRRTLGLNESYKITN